MSALTFSSARGTYIVLDATEIHRDWLLAGLEFRLLRFLSREAGVKTVVPRSVIIEAVANHDREQERARKSFIKASSELRRLGGRALAAVGEFPESSPYAEQLAGRLESLWVEVVAPPNVTHESIVERAARRVPPFDNHGSGYRDTLTWMTCVDLAKSGKNAYLVSRDNDFADGAGDLHPALAAEVASYPGTVTLVRHLGKWLTALIPWSGVSDLREAAGLVRDEELAGFFAPWDMFDDPQLTALDMGLPSGSEIIEIGYRGSGALERLSHSRGADGSDRVTYEFPIDFEVEFVLPAEEALASGLLQFEREIAGPASVATVVSMVGVMSVLHDELDTDYPFEIEYVDFRLDSRATPTGEQGTPTRES